MNDVLVTGGGIIPEEDILVLNNLGIGKIFTPGANTIDIATYIKEWVTHHPKSF
jgi:methylmalonyl-CoA mutase C-terminal domain/subunit